MSRRGMVRGGGLALLLSLAFSGCVQRGDRSASDGAVGRLVLLDSLVLEEPDSVTIGRVSHLAWSPDGEYLVTDRVGARVLRYDAAGRLLGVIGRKGRGPGEFVSVGPVALLGDSVLVVEDLGRQRTFLFGRRDGSYRRSVGHEFGLVTHVSVANGIVWLSLPHVSRHTSLVRWDLLTDRATRCCASIRRRRFLSARARSFAATESIWRTARCCR